MSSVAATESRDIAMTAIYMILAFVVVMFGLNLIEFGRLD